MTIHSDFWKERHRVYTNRVYLRSVRDSNRQRCYNWEFEHLRPLQSKFEDRQAAKGFARLCMKVALRQLLALYPEANEALIRASFKAALTKENQRKCNANAAGAYFAAWGWTDVIIAHEVAHWADQWAHKLRGNPGFSVDYEGHGPRWRGWFAFILGKVGMRRHSEFPSDARALAVTTLNKARLPFSMPE